MFFFSVFPLYIHGHFEMRCPEKWTKISFVCWIRKSLRGLMFENNECFNCPGFYKCKTLFKTPFQMCCWIHQTKLKLRFLFGYLALLKTFWVTFGLDPFYCIYFDALSKLKFITAYKRYWSVIWIHKIFYRHYKEIYIHLQNIVSYFHRMLIVCFPFFLCMRFSLVFRISNDYSRMLTKFAWN